MRLCDSKVSQRAIAFFMPSMRGGGAERVLVNLAEGLVERGESVHVVLAEAVGPHLDHIPPGVKVVNLRSPRVLVSLGPLTRYLRRERPRVLISSMNHANLVALWASRLAGWRVPVIVTQHNTLSQTARHAGVFRNLESRVLRAFYPWAARVVVVSRGAADDFAVMTGIPRDRIEVIYNPVITRNTLAAAREAPDHPWFAPGQPPVILAVGRLTQQKDFATLIRAFAETRRQRAVRLIILGEGPDRAELAALVDQLGVADDVSLPGFTKNAIAYMAASALFVLSSAWEGLPTVLIEALAAGTRVVSTDCPSGPREILQDGRLGTLVPVGDPAALANAMNNALSGGNGSIPSEALVEFTRDAAVEHYLRLIRSI
jgi:glycosyltransferase involved in cell wall biosynthesis